VDLGPSSILEVDLHVHLESFRRFNPPPEEDCPRQEGGRSLLLEEVGTCLCGPHLHLVLVKGRYSVEEDLLLRDNEVRVGRGDIDDGVEDSLL